MKKQYLFDTNFVVSLIDAGDVHHTRAKNLFDHIQSGEVFFSDIVVNETLSVLARRCEAKKRSADFKNVAKIFTDCIQGQPILCLYELLPRNLKEVINMMIQYEGALNFHDCLMAFFLKDLPHVGFVTFDEDFKRVGGLSVTP